VLSSLLDRMLIYRLQDANNNGPYSIICGNNVGLKNELSAIRQKLNRPYKLNDGSERYPLNDYRQTSLSEACAVVTPKS
jgi:hypothetical protein